MSYFWPFTHGIITQNTNHRIIVYLCRAIQQVRHLGRGTEKEESNRKLYRTKEGVQSKKWYHLHKFFYLLFSVTQSFLLGFSWSSDNITASKKQSILKKKPASVPEITKSYFQKNIIISLLCQCGLLIHTCVSKN